MQIANYCPTNNFFPVGAQAEALVKTFCLCPAAQSVVAEIENSTPISVYTGDFPHHRVALGENDDKVEIQIPTKNLKTTEALNNLAFEIFNAKEAKKFQDIRDHAKEGNLNIDEYSNKIEIQEFISKQGRNKLIRDCESYFKIQPNPGTADLVTQLWNHEINCHTDKIKEQWINMYQKIYCESHPEDLKSCNVRQQDLCDLYKFHNLPKDEQKRIAFRRTCQKLPTAPQKIKDYYLNKGIEVICRIVLKDEL